MKMCSKCNNELIDNLEVTARGVYEVGISYKKGIASTHRGNLKATLCPNCGDVSFFLESDAIAIIVKDVQK